MENYLNKPPELKYIYTIIPNLENIISMQSLTDQNISNNTQTFQDILPPFEQLTKENVQYHNDDSCGPDIRYLNSQTATKYKDHIICTNSDIKEQLEEKLIRGKNCLKKRLLTHKRLRSTNKQSNSQHLHYITDVYKHIKTCTHKLKKSNKQIDREIIHFCIKYDLLDILSTLKINNNPDDNKFDNLIFNISNENPRKFGQFKKDLALLPHISEAAILRRISHLTSIKNNIFITEKTNKVLQQVYLEFSFLNLLYPIRRNVYEYQEYNYRNFEKLQHKIPISNYYRLLAKALHQGLNMKSITEIRNTI